MNEKNDKKPKWVKAKDLLMTPILTQQFQGILFAAAVELPLFRVGITQTSVIRLGGGGAPTLVPITATLREAPEYIVTFTNKTITTWTRGSGNVRRIIGPN